MDKKSIKTRILVSILMLIVFSFIGVTVAFNILMNAYIKNSATVQLKQAISTLGQVPQGGGGDKFIEGNRHEKQDEKYFDILKQSKQLVRRVQEHVTTENVIVNNEYEMVFPTQDTDFLGDMENYELLVQTMKSQAIVLGSEKVSRISTEKGNYYLVSLEIEEEKVENENYLVLFIDISSTLNLEKQMNMVLGIIMCIATILAIFTAFILSRRIARPIESLCEVAEKLGRGDFSEGDFDFKDQEIDTLSKVMNKSAKYLDQYDKEQKIFFQNVSHELRTPLMSIKGYAEAIKYNVLDKEEASTIILEESDRLGELIEELLYVSKMDNLTKDYKLIECDLREILSNCTLRQKAKAISRGIQFIYDFDETPVVLKCDEKNISRACSNLIANALRYADKEIIIGCKVIEGKIHIYIEDDGEGIKEEDMPYIFDRFYKGEKGKHGIGLSIVKSVIGQHKGEVCAENTEQGARFNVFINN